MSKEACCNSDNKYKVRMIDVTYRKDQGGIWSARVYVPDGEGPFPLLLDVHGGAWGAGGCGDNEILDLALAGSGMVVIAVELRKAPAYTYPSQVMDVNFATRWAKAHAEEYNAVPDSIGGLGTSSGGHTLFLSAMRPGDPRYGELVLPEGEGIDACLSYVIGAWPVIDPYARYLYAKENNLDFLVNATDAYFLSPENMKEGSPFLSIEKGEPHDLPPALILQGTGDTNVPLDSVDRFAEAYRKAGGIIDLKWFPDMPHNFALKPGEATSHAIEVMKKFIFGRLSGN